MTIEATLTNFFEIVKSKVENFKNFKKAIESEIENEIQIAKLRYNEFLKITDLRIPIEHHDEDYNEWKQRGASNASEIAVWSVIGKYFRQFKII